jgi:hypothetical protein
MSVQAGSAVGIRKCDDGESLRATLLTEKDCKGDSQATASTEINEDDVLPYSFVNEVRFFFGKGIPLGLSSFLEWGAPPWLAMIMAGHTQTSDQLQSALGYGRVFYNCTSLILLIGACNFFKTVLPGCIGAGRKDRIPNYLRRSLVLVTLLMIP